MTEEMLELEIPDSLVEGSVKITGKISPTPAATLLEVYIYIYKCIYIYIYITLYIYIYILHYI